MSKEKQEYSLRKAREFRGEKHSLTETEKKKRRRVAIFLGMEIGKGAKPEEAILKAKSVFSGVGQFLEVLVTLQKGALTFTWPVLCFEFGKEIGKGEEIEKLLNRIELRFGEDVREEISRYYQEIIGKIGKEKSNAL